jgi:hypothetical protein
MPHEHQPHPADFRELCQRAVAVLQDLKAAGPTDRTPLLLQAQDALRDIDQQVKTLDLGDPAFNDEQGDVMAASSALQAIELDRGGPKVGKYADQAIEAIERLAKL